MKRVYPAGLIVLLFACISQAQVSTTFTYTQTDAATGSGTIAPFVIHDAGGDINFAATPMPSALVINPGTGQFMGKQTAQAGTGDESNNAVGLVWNGSVTATGTRGAQIYTVQVPLKFVPKVTQTPTDTNDYNFNVSFGDDVTGGTDAVSTNTPTNHPRFAMWFNRDDVVDALDTANVYQRYTQLNNTFTAGQNTFTNTDTTTTAIKDATDSGDPQGTDAAGRNLAFYFGWRDQGTLTPSVVLVDDFKVGGLLNADLTTLNPPVPEPASLLGLSVLAALGLARHRKA